ncbi:enoyl-CoA hydratase-related protein [Natranaerobius thermophilus]|uniref:short-chain-enoyl-CoA hydratase n=1 Tax=Natranaerobius thermophilus (strain ATCC BAA-1301 / DSM 18059 / JW/NM-WN-LF) TaxID=457570 RepID=B2A632_NATTJ|nr:enoyl-CoA hydratase-related protein [Natranaerobius thermophilus]ACB85449.1 short chain enoyl-CoA hydratase [Natranaerobius thermophilus JW/NM-WN-LF]
MTSEKLILKEMKNDSVALLKINRPKALNALNVEVLKELYNELQEIEKDETVKCVIITGSGEKAFVGGADIGSMKDMDTVEARKFSEFGNEVMTYIENLKIPVIAAINGYALGGGLELALSADIRIASENAKFGTPEINLGIFPGFGGTQRLPKIVGLHKAKELIFTGEIITAEDAKEANLINKVVKQEELMEVVTKMASKIASKSSIPLKLAKQVINRGYEEPIETGSLMETSSFSVCFSTEDQKEGMEAFLENRKPTFKDK